MCRRKELFDQMNSLESRRAKAVQEMERVVDYKDSVGGYISQLDLQIIKIRKEINKTAKGIHSNV